MPKLSLPAFCVPFVTRAFRGGRRRRFTFFSGLLGLLALVMSFWLALGSGPMEQELRVALDLEQSEWEREQNEYLIIVHGAEEEKMMRDGFVLESTRGEARGLLQAAVAKPTLEPEFMELQERAQALLELEPGSTVDYYDPYFEWYDGWQIQRIESIVANGLEPRVVRYASPLGVVDAFSLLGVISGSILILLAFVFGPLTVGVQQAQEVNENTLQPLTGTALTARQLALGLASGPLAVVGLLALPQIALYLVASGITGGLAPAAGLIVIATLGCAAVSLTTQLIGHMMGRRRTPGIVGGFLLVALGTGAAVGMGFGLNLDGDTARILTLLPQGSAFYLLHEAFAGGPLLAASEVSAAISSMAAGAMGLIVLSVLLLLVLERKIAGRDGPALTRVEALVGLLTATVLALITVPYIDDMWRQDNDEVYYMMTLALLAPSLTLLMMSRVPVGDLPPNMRRLSLPRLLGELAVGMGIHLLAVLLISRDPLSFGVFHPVSLAYLVWCGAVLGLLAVRAVAYPVSILNGVWLAFCTLALSVAFGHAAVWSAETGHLGLSHVFALGELSPVLGLIQVALTVFIPLSLVRALRKNLAAIR